MKAEYKRDLNHAYLILDSAVEVDPSSFQIRMIVKNQMEGFLKCSIHMLDNRPLFYYDITSKQSLKTIYSYIPISGDVLRLLFESIFEAVEILESFLLDTSGLMLEPEMIYLDIEREKVYFCYLPGQNGKIGANFRKLTEYLLPRIEHNQQEAVVLGYGVYRQAMEETFEMENFRTILCQDRNIKPEIKPALKEDSLEERKYEEEKTQREILLESLFNEDEQETMILWPAVFWGIGSLILILAFILVFLGLLTKWILLFPISGAAAAAIWYQIKKRIQHEADQNREEKEMIEMFREQGESEPADIRESVDISQTILMGEQSMEKHPYLEASGHSQMGVFILNKENIIIGKVKDADFILSSGAVSRIHAWIYQEQGQCYLEDMNSRNGTYVNGKLLTPGESHRLQDEDCIRFADMEYRFRKPG